MQVQYGLRCNGYEQCIHPQVACLHSQEEIATQIAHFQFFQKIGRKASLSGVQRGRIETLHEERHSERKIAVKMACNKTAVHTTINNFELYDNYSDKKKSGWPRKTSRRDDRMMKLTVSRSPTSN